MPNFMLCAPCTHVMEARCPQLFKSTRLNPAEDVLPTDTRPAMLNAGKRLDLCLVGQRLRETERRDIEAKRIGNTGIVVARETAVELAIRPGLRDGGGRDGGVGAGVRGIAA